MPCNAKFSENNTALNKLISLFNTANSHFKIIFDPSEGQNRDMVYFAPPPPPNTIRISKALNCFALLYCVTKRFYLGMSSRFLKMNIFFPSLTLALIGRF